MTASAITLVTDPQEIQIICSSGALEMMSHRVSGHRASNRDRRSPGFLGSSRHTRAPVQCPQAAQMFGIPLSLYSSGSHQKGEYFQRYSPEAEENIWHPPTKCSLPPTHGLDTTLCCQKPQSVFNN